MKLSDFYYSLPPEYIAQTPVEPRDSSRLLVLERETGAITHAVFSQIGDYLSPGDLLVINQTRVMPARVFARKIPTGGRVELLLLKQLEPKLWEALVGGKRVGLGKRLALRADLEAEVIEEYEGPRRLLKFNRLLDEDLESIGEMPLPPYIHEKLDDPSRYQTVYAEQTGSAAAPTAGLHFTPELIRRLEEAGIGVATVTLHVGLDTFAPVTEEDVTQHRIHSEWCLLPAATAKKINQTRTNGGKVVAVGTTSVRTLETAFSPSDDIIRPFEGQTELYILPGYRFRVVDVMLTNFHLPKSTLLMLVSAFAGREAILETYQVAINEGYRFYSFGDAMLIL